MFDLINYEEAEARVKDAGYSLEKFFEKADIVQTTWWRWKSGKNFPSYAKAKRVHDVLQDISPDPKGEATQ